MSRKSEEVKLEDNLRITVKELTGLQVDKVFETLDDGYKLSHQDRLMAGKKFPEFVLDMVTAPIKLSELIKKKDLAPSEYEPVYDAAIRVNDFLSQALQDYQMEMVRLQELEDALSTMDGSKNILSSLSGLVTSEQKSMDSPT